MITVCPYCKQPLPEGAHVPRLRPRWTRIYNALAGAGQEGVATEDLLVRMYADDELPTPGGYTVLRVSICDMNKALRPYDQHIVNVHRGRYCLTTSEPKHEEEVQPQADH